MANSITSSALVAIQERLEKIFTGDTPNKYPYFEPGHVVAGLMERHRAQLSPHLNSGGQVIGYEAHYLTPGSNTITQNDTPATVKAALDCNVDEGQYPTSAKSSLTHNKAIVSNVSVDDDLANSLFNSAPRSKDGLERAAELVAERFQFGKSNIRGKLDEWGIDFLHASRTQVNNDETLPSYLTYDSSNYWFEADASRFQSADFLTDIDATVSNNNMMDYFMVSGRRNFYNAIVDGRFRRQNDNERYLTRFDTTDVFFDIRRMDKRLSDATSQAGAGFTFAVGDGSYTIWNYADETPVPVQIDDDKWRFTIRDEKLRIWFNGRLVPVVYEVLYQRVCVGRDSLLNPYFKHLFELRFLGGLHKAPAASDGHTGILELKSIPGV